MNKRIIIIIIIWFIYTILGSISIQYGTIQLDEKEFHLPTVNAFYNNNFFSVINSQSYKTASTPLPYILASGIHKILNIEPSVISVRLINIVVSLLSLLMFSLILKRENISPLFVFILIFYPYFLKPSFAFYMSIYGLLFYLIFIYYIQKEDILSLIIAAISLSFAALSQQFYLVLFLLFIVSRYYQSVINKNRKTFAISLAAISIVSIPFVFLYNTWGGLTHPSFGNWGVEFRIEYLTAILVVIGGVFLPVFIFELRKISYKYILIISAFSLMFGILFYPNWTSIPAAGSITGLTFHFLDIVTRQNFIIGSLLRIFLIFAGLGTTFIILKESFKKNLWLLMIFIFLIIAFSINKIPSERHLLPLIATAIILYAPAIKNKNISIVWILYQATVGIIYFAYMI